MNFIVQNKSLLLTNSHYIKETLKNNVYQLMFTVYDHTTHHYLCVCCLCGSFVLRGESRFGLTLGSWMFITLVNLVGVSIEAK